MRYKLNEYRSELTDSEIIEDIKRVALESKSEYISISIYKDKGNYSQTTIQGHFGTWRNALKTAGLRNTRKKFELKHISNEDYFDDLREIAHNLNKKTVLFKDYKKYGKYSAEHIITRFSSWDNVLISAGLEPTGLARKKIDEETLFIELEKIWIRLGRQPTSTDIIKGGISKYSIDTYKRRFGGWRKTLEKFVEYMNQVDSGGTYDEQVPQENEINENLKVIQESDDITFDLQPKIRHRTSRNINMRLRFKVLKRDNFKCCACGSSPAKDPSIELHVDHIIPWSKGGETTLDNLQTLCSKCNLGKSDVL